MTIKAFAAKKPKGTLVPFRYSPRPPGDWDVEIKISHCGLCRSDIHLIDNDWNLTRYPLVPGHEIIGRVVRKGPKASHLEIGQRVGVGWQRGACFSCEFCDRGDENLCFRSQSTCVRHFGGFAESVAVDGRFAFPIPANLASERAAPLLCAGITVFSPLRAFGVQKNSRVGILGIGGLGHLALQFADKWGCAVTALSSSPEKEQEARQFGADEFVLVKGKKAPPAAHDKLDFLLVTVPTDLDWASYMNTLRPDGKLCFVGVPPKPVRIPSYVFIDGRKSICGSPIGGRALMREMLDFAARHKIEAQTETAPMSEINTAVKKVRRNEARYRMVLQN